MLVLMLAHNSYTEWVQFDPTTATPTWNVTWGRELYDHGSAPVPSGLFHNENVNLAESAEHGHVVEQLSKQLHLGEHMPSLSLCLYMLTMECRMACCTACSLEIS